MQTVFSGNKLGEFMPQKLIGQDMTLFGPSALRFSHSPQKTKIAKKFYHSMRNKSIKNLEEGISPRHQLENLIRKEKIILFSTKANFNDLLLGQEVLLKERQLVVLPSIEIRRVSQSDNRSSPTKKKILAHNLADLTDFRKEYKSNILGNLETICSSHEINRTIIQKMQKFNPQPPKNPQTEKICNIPKIVNKRTVYEQQGISNNSLDHYSPSKLQKTISIVKFEPRESVQKKYKKGFLTYEPGALEYWQKLKQHCSKPPLFKVDSKIITAKICYALDLQNLTPLVGLGEHSTIEIASLSKIMTCYLSILICQKYDVDIKNCFYRVPDKIIETPGTSAELQAGDLLNIEDLLYAVMLPSGNDASICLAELMGKVLQKYKKREQKKSFFQSFLTHMNLFSKELDIPQEWNNSSGLPSNPNFSTANAIVSLSALALRNDLFRKIVTTKEIELEIRNDRYGLSKKKIWKNTNKLLEKGWGGVKTGTTETAGHCLIAVNQNILIGVFDCQTMSRRFVDSIRLLDHLKSLKEISESKK